MTFSFQRRFVANSIIVQANNGMYYWTLFGINGYPPPNQQLF